MNDRQRPNKLQHLLPLIKQSLRVPANSPLLPKGVQAQGFEGAMDVLNTARKRVDRLMEQQTNE